MFLRMRRLRKQRSNEELAIAARLIPGERERQIEHVRLNEITRSRRVHARHFITPHVIDWAANQRAVSHV